MSLGPIFCAALAVGCFIWAMVTGADPGPYEPRNCGLSVESCEAYDP